MWCQLSQLFHVARTRDSNPDARFQEIKPLLLSHLFCGFNGWWVWWVYIVIAAGILFSSSKFFLWHCGRHIVEPKVCHAMASFYSWRASTFTSKWGHSNRKRNARAKETHSDPKTEWKILFWEPCFCDCKRPRGGCPLESYVLQYEISAWTPFMQTMLGMIVDPPFCTQTLFPEQAKCGPGRVQKEGAFQSALISVWFSFSCKLSGCDFCFQASGATFAKECYK